MCGIFGVLVNEKSTLSFDDVKNLTNRLFILSESRGKESAGLAIKNMKDGQITVLKNSGQPSKFIKSKIYEDFLSDSLRENYESNHVSSSFGIIAHSRLVTDGGRDNNDNNQPVIKNGCVAIHNGIVTNVDELWKTSPQFKRSFEVDTEILIDLVTADCRNVGIPKSLKSTFSLMEGAASIAMVFNDLGEIGLATNTGSLYTYNNSEYFIFASEKFILESALKNINVLDKATKVNPGHGKTIDLKNLSVYDFQFRDEVDGKTPPKHPSKPILDLTNVRPSKPTISTNSFDKLETILNYDAKLVLEQKRCCRCILPVQFPFIEFDGEGLCNYCRNYIPKFKGDRKKDLERIFEPYKKNKDLNCIVAFSGGRDSSYGLHYLVKELGLNPITYTYDWGMITDLARRNIARMCGKLGLENIVISADIDEKRRNIQKNILAWLKKPHLGMVPLFMAGDKQFFKYANVVRAQTGIDLDIWLMNKLENTDFKAGFAGISPNFKKRGVEYQSFPDKIRLVMFYMKNFFLNTSYINSSLFDTVSAYFSYYFEPRPNSVLLYDYIGWDEKNIEKTLKEEYNWEMATDTSSTWRIGDGTVPFYNYIYYSMAGFTEFDTFRSNQIRENMITRDEALKLVVEENKPRFESIKWYLDTVGLDFERTIKRINEISQELTK